MVIKAVPEEKPSPAKGKEKPQSTIQFPYYSLGAAINVAKVIHEQAGGTSDRAALAGLLKYANDRTGSFLSLVAATRMYGLVEPSGNGGLRLTPLGRSIVAPVSPKDADDGKVEAFLGVPLFKEVYDRFHGGMLPEQPGIRNLFEQLGVVKTRVAPTYGIMMSSAETAGFFRIAGATRMIKPNGTGTPAPKAAKEEKNKPDPVPDVHRNGGGNGGGGGDGLNEIHPAFAGLLRALPPIGARLTPKRRKALVDAFANAVGFLYPEDETTS